MSELTKSMLESDEATIAGRTVRVGHDWLWPDVVALVLVSAGVGFCVGVLI